MAHTRPNQNRPTRTGRDMTNHRHTIRTPAFIKPEPTPPKSASKRSISGDGVWKTPTPVQPFQGNIAPLTPGPTPSRLSPRTQGSEKHSEPISDIDDESSSDISDTPPSIPDPEWIKAAQRDAAAACGPPITPRNPILQVSRQEASAACHSNSSVTKDTKSAPAVIHDKRESSEAIQPSTKARHPMSPTGPVISPSFTTPPTTVQSAPSNDNDVLVSGPVDYQTTDPRATTTGSYIPNAAIATSNNDASAAPTSCPPCLQPPVPTPAVRLPSAVASPWTGSHASAGPDQRANTDVASQHWAEDVMDLSSNDISLNSRAPRFFYAWPAQEFTGGLTAVEVVALPRYPQIVFPAWTGLADEPTRPRLKGMPKSNVSKLRPGEIFDWC